MKWKKRIALPATTLAIRGINIHSYSEDKNQEIMYLVVPSPSYILKELNI
ncbi:hypothetical protein HB852_03920 [Listeria grandensis]|nr:hypothetical protein [Listeria grandensis]MBC1473773.1 hypothetical protein [Listeria grandensis]